MATVTLLDAEAPLILTIDAGTSSTRALLFDRLARTVAGVVAQEQYAVRTSTDGAIEDDPDEAIARIERCIDAVLTQIGERASDIAAVAADTLVSNIIAIDSNNRPISPIITYADTRNADDSLALRKLLDERAVHERTGCLLRTSYWPARLAWFRRTQPAIWRSTARWITLGEYLELRLFERCRVSYSVASWTGLLDRRALVWDESLLDTLGVTTKQFSPLVDVDEPLQGLSARYAARWPTLRNVPWFPAIGDGAAANVGSGCTNPSRVAITVGTTGAIRVAQPDVPQVPEGLWCYRVDREHALLGGATSEGGNIYAWMHNALRLSDSSSVGQALAMLPPDGHGLTILPFFAGERSPGWAGDVQATVTGLTLSTTPVEILRAGLEAVAYRFALIAERIRSQNSQFHSLIASGGALLNSPTWMQIIADVLGVPVVTSTEPEATSRGVALLALKAIGNIPSIEALPTSDGVVHEPIPAHHERYKEAIERQRRLYALLIGEENQEQRTKNK